jgi:hypothetical protein
VLVVIHFFVAGGVFPGKERVPELAVVKGPELTIDVVIQRMEQAGMFGSASFPRVCTALSSEQGVPKTDITAAINATGFSIKGSTYQACDLLAAGFALKNTSLPTHEQLLYAACESVALGIFYSLRCPSAGTRRLRARVARRAKKGGLTARQKRKEKAMRRRIRDEIRKIEIGDSFAEKVTEVFEEVISAFENYLENYRENMNDQSPPTLVDCDGNVLPGCNNEVCQKYMSLSPISRDLLNDMADGSGRIFTALKCGECEVNSETAKEEGCTPRPSPKPSLESTPPPPTPPPPTSSSIPAGCPSGSVRYTEQCQLCSPDKGFHTECNRRSEFPDWTEYNERICWHSGGWCALEDCVTFTLCPPRGD